MKMTRWVGLSAFVLSLLPVPCARAQITPTNFYWKNGSATGLWSTAANWTNYPANGAVFASGGMTNYIMNFATNHAALLSTNNLGIATYNGFRLNGLNFSNSTVTISGSNLVFIANGPTLPTVNQNGASNAVIASGIVLSNTTTFGGNGAGLLTAANIVSGPGALLKVGTSTLVLASNNTYAGGTTISAGTLQIGSGANGSVSGSITNNSTSGGLVFFRSNTVTVANVLTGTGTNTFRGTGANGQSSFTLSGANTETGPMVIDRARVSVASQGTLGAAPVVIATNQATLYPTAGTYTNSALIGGYGWLETGGTSLGALRLQGSTWNGTIGLLASAKISSYGGNGVVGGSITGAYAVTVAEGAATQILALNGNNTFSGGLTNGTGVLALGNANALGTGPLVMNGGTLSNALDGAVYANTISLQSAATINTPINTQTTFSGPITNTGSLAIYAGPNAAAGRGTVVLSGTNTFTGAVGINNGVVIIDNSQGLGTGTKTVTISRNTNYDPELVLDGSGGAIVLPAGLSFTTSQATFPAISNAAGDNVVNGNFTLAGGGGSTMLLVGGGTLTMNGSFTPSTTLRSLVLDGAAVGTINGTLQDSGTYYLGLIKQGSGTWTLAGNNTFTAGTAVNNGTLVLASALAVQNSTVTIGVDNGLVFSGAAAFTAGGLAGAGRLTLTNDANAGVALTVGGNGASTLYSGNLDDGGLGGALVKAGTGTLTLGGSNTYGGGTTLGAGTLSVGDYTNLPAAGGLTFNGGVLQITGTTITNLDGYTINWGTFNGGFDINDAAHTLPVTNLITGAGSLIKAGAGTLTLNNAGSSTRLLQVDGGILDLAADLTLGTNGMGGISLQGAGGTINSSGGRILLNGFASTADMMDWRSTGTTVINAAIVESPAAPGAGLDFYNSGTIVLNGVNTFGGRVMLAGTAASVTNVGNAGFNSNLGTNGALWFGYTATAGRLVYAGAGETSDKVITLNGTTGGATIDQSGTGLLKFTSDVNVQTAGAKTITLQGSTAGAGEISGAITNSSAGATSVTKAGTGTWTLSGTNTLGAVTVSDGRLAIAGPTVANSLLSVGNLAASRGVLAVSADLSVNQIQIGNAAGGAGAVFQTGGTLSVTTNTDLDANFGVGYAAGSYGYYNLSGGTVATATRLEVGTYPGDGNGVFDMSGGLVAAPLTYAIIGRANAASNWGIVNVNGGAFYGSTSNGLVMNWDASAAGRASYGQLTIANGGTAYSGPGTSQVLDLNHGTGNTGVLNLLTNGTLVANRVTASAAGTSLLNIDGGVLVANPGTTLSNTFLQGLTAATIYAGGATLDTASNSIIVNQSLAGPVGYGLSGIALATGGAGYIGAPIVSISGGSGTGATAIVQVDFATGAVTNLLVTSTGSGYLSGDTITVQLIGGGFTTAATLGANSLNPNANTGGLIKRGTGLLTLTGANTYGGNTLIGAGTLSVADTGSLPGWDTAGRFAVSNAAALAVGNAVSDDQIVTLLGTSNFLAGASLGFDTTAGDRTYASNLVDTAAGAMGLVKVGANALVLSATNTYSGGTRIGAGTLSVGDYVNLPAAGGLTFGGGVLQVTGTIITNLNDYTVNWGTFNGGFDVSDAANTLTVTNPLTGTAGLIKAGAGTLVLNNGGSSTPLLQLDGGILDLGAGDLTLGTIGSGAQALQGSGGAINSSGGRILLNGFASTANMMDWKSSGAITVNVAIAESPAAPGAGIDFYNSGTIVLNGLNTFGGRVMLAGTAASVTNVGNAGFNSNLGTNGDIWFGSSTTAGKLVYTGAGETSDKVITLNGSTGGATIDQSGTGLLRFTSDLNVQTAGAKTLTLQGSTAGTGEFAGAITNSSSGATALAKTGTGTWTLSGTNAYSGATTVSGGTLTLAAGGTNALGAVTINGGVAGATLNIDGPTTNTTMTVGSANGDRAMVAITTNQTSWKMFVGNASNAAGAVIQHAGVVNVGTNVSGTAVLSLGDNGGYGYYRINGGALNSGQIAPGGSTAGASSGVLDIMGGAVTATAGTGSGWLILGWGNGNGEINIYDGTLSAPPGNNDTTFGYAINKNSFGMMSLLGTGAVMNATGGGNVRAVEMMRNSGNLGSVLNLNAGTLIANQIKSTSNGLTVLNLDGGTIQVNGGTSWATNFLQGLAAATVYDGGVTLDTTNATVTIAQSLAGPVGYGLVSIPVTNGGAGYIGAPLVMITGGVGTGATAIAQVDLGAGSPTYGQVTNLLITSAGSGYGVGDVLTVTLNGGGCTTTAAVDAAALALNSNAGGLTKLGSGILTLSGANTYGGNTLILTGVLSIASTGALPGWDTAGRYTVYSGAGLAVGNAVTDDHLATILGTGNFSAGASAGFDTTAGARTYASNIADTVAGPLGLVKVGANTLVLTGASTYSGPTWIRAGSLSVGSLNSVNGGAGVLGAPTNAAGGTIAIGDAATAGTLLYTGTGDTSDRVLDLAGATGGAVVDQSGSGLLQFTSDLTATGAGAKTLTLQGSTGGTGEIAGAVADSGGGSTALSKAGTGVWMLSGANTYSGGTTVGAGTLMVGAGGTSGRLGPGDVTNNGTLVFNRTDDYGGVVNNDMVGTGTNRVRQGVLTLGGSAFTNNGLFIADTANTPATLNLAGPAALVAGGAGALAVGVASNATGTINISGGSLTVSNQLYIAAGTGYSRGIVNLSNGSVVVHNWTGVGRGAANGSVGNYGELNISGGSWSNLTASSFTIVSYGGNTGRVSVTGGNLYTLNSLFVAEGNGASAAAPAVGTMTIGGGSVNVGGTLLVGQNSAAAGALIQTGGVLVVAGEFDMGYSNALNYGYYQNAGGIATNNSWMQAGRGGLGLIYLTGGTNVMAGSGQGIAIANMPLSGQYSTGVLYVAGGTVRNAGRLGVGWAGTNGASRGEATIANASVILGTGGTLLNQAGSATGILNLNGGGVLSTVNIYKNVAGGLGILNLDGGTIVAQASQTLMGPGAGGAGALDAAYLYGNGATIDSSNYNITVSQNLLAPPGSGVTNIPFAGPAAGYVGAPYVAIAGGGGTGATAIAQFDFATGSVTGILVTSAGAGYTNAPTVTLMGGGVANTALGLADLGVNSSGTLTKQGIGGLTLTGTNSYAGGTVIAGGAVNFLTAAALPAVGLVTIGNGGALAANGPFTTVSNWLNSGLIATNGAYGALVLAGNSAENLDFGTLAGGVYSNMALGGMAGYTSVYTGTLAPHDGLYRLGGGNGTLVLADDLALSGAAGVQIGNAYGMAGTVWLAGSNDFSGGTVLYPNATLSIDKSSSLGGGALTLNGGTLQVRGTTLNTLAPNPILGGNNTLDVNHAGNTFTLASNLSANGSLTKSGAGTLVLGGSNDIAGAVTVAAGALRLTNGHALDGAGSNVTVAAGAALQLQGGIVTEAGDYLSLTGLGVAYDGALRNLSGTNTWAGPVTMPAGAQWRINSDAGLLTLSGPITNNAGSIISYVGGAGDTLIGGSIAGAGALGKDGSGTLTLTGTNVYTGGTYLYSGRLVLDFSQSAAATNNIINNTTLNLGNGWQANTASLLVIGSGSGVNTQSFSTVNLYPGLATLGASNYLGGGATVLALGGITRNAGGGALDLMLPAGGGAILTTSGTNAAGLFNQLLTVGGTDWATSLDAAAPFAITNYPAANYVVPTGAGPSVTSDLLANVKIDGTSSGLVSLDASNVVLNTLLVNDAVSRSLALNGTGTLSTTAVFLPTASAGATIGTNINDGLLRSSGELVLMNYSPNALTINSAVNNSGPLTVNGTGPVTFNGTNLVTGGTVLNGGVVNFTANSVLAGVTNTGSALTFGGSTNVLSGTLLMTGSSRTTIAGPTSLNVFDLGNGANSRAVAYVSTNVSVTTQLRMGQPDNGHGAGALYQTGGNLLVGTATAGYVLTLADATGSYGYYQISGGTYASGNGNGGGGACIGYRGTAVMDLLGGQMLVTNNGFYVARGASNLSGPMSIFNVLGGSFLGSPTNSLLMNGGTGATFAQTTIGNGGVVNAANANTGMVVNLTAAASAGNTAVVNLNAGGLLIANQILAANAGATFLNFDGGTLVAGPGTIWSNAFLQGLSNATIYAGGATLDVSNNNIIVNQNLRSPGGFGLTDIAVADGGSGYIGAPAVRITGGAGTGATAIAQIDAAGVLTNLLITSPGWGYLPGDAIVVQLVGGGFLQAATLGANAFAPNANTGGLTKLGAGTLTLGGNNSYRGLTTIDDGTLVLAETGVSSIGGLAGPGTLVHSGSGMTILNGGSGGYTGAMSVNSGVVQFATAGAVPALTNVLVNAGGAAAFDFVGVQAALDQGIVPASAGTLAVTTNSAAEPFDFSGAGGSPAFPSVFLGAVGTVDYTGAVTPNASTYRLGGGGGKLIFDSAITDGTVIVGGAGTVALVQANTYAGGTLILPGGTLQLGNGAAAGSLAGSITNNGILQFLRSDSFTLTNDIVSGAGGTTKQLGGSGQLTLTGTNALGTLAVGSGSSAAPLVLAGDSSNVAALVTVGNTRMADVGNYGKLVVQDNASLLVNGSLLIGDANGSTGDVVQTGGLVTVASQFRLGHYPNNTSSYTISGGSLVLTAMATIFPFAGSGTSESNGVLYLGVDGTGVFNQQGGTVAASGMVLDNRGNTAGTDTYTLSGGRLVLGPWGIQGTNPTVAVNLGGGVVAASSNWGARTSFNLTNLNGGVTFDPAGYTITLSNTLYGTGGLTVSNAGMVVLSGTNTYGGSTRLEGGRLYVTSDLNLGAVPDSFSANNIILNGGTLSNAVTVQVNANRGLALDVNGGTLAPGANQLQIYGIIGDLGPGAGPLTIGGSGSGLVALYTNNTYSGGTLLQPGAQLMFNATDSVSNFLGTGALTLNGGSMRPLAASTAVTISNAVLFAADTTVLSGGTNLTFSGPMTLTNGNRTLTQSSARLVTISGAIGDSGQNLGFIKAGTGALVLSGGNTYGGGTTVSNGTLQLGGDNVLGSGTLTMSGAILSADGAAPRALTNSWAITIASGLGSAANPGLLTLSGPLDFAGASRTLTNYSDAVIAGSSGNGGLGIKRGPGTLTFQGGVHDWTAGAALQVQDGTLVFDGAIVTNQDAFRVNSGVAYGVARLVVTNGAALICTNAGANIRLGYSSTTTATNILDVAGRITMNTSGTAGMLQLGSTCAKAIANLLPGGELEIAAVTNMAANPTEFNFDGGILRARINNAAFMAGLDAAYVRARGAAIDSAGYDITVGQALLDGGGNGGLTKLGEGTLRLSAVNPYTGDTVVSNGTLQIGASGSIGNSLRINLSSLTSTVDVTAVSGGFHLLAGQQVQGVGTVRGGLIMDPGARLSPGNSVGTLNVTGDLTLAAGTTNIWDLVAPDTSDLVNVSGALDLNNIGWGDFSFLPDAAVGTNVQTYTLFHSGTNVLGSLGAVTNGTVNGYSAYLHVGGAGNDDLQLTVIPEPATFGLVALFAAAALLRRRKDQGTKGPRDRRSGRRGAWSAE